MKNAPSPAGDGVPLVGFSALATGAAWMTASVTSLACAGLSQRLVTRTSPKLVMAIGMALIGAGTLWATQAPASGTFWPDLAGPFFVAGIGTAFAFIPVSIGALAGVTGLAAIPVAFVLIRRTSKS